MPFHGTLSAEQSAKQKEGLKTAKQKQKRLSFEACILTAELGAEERAAHAANEARRALVGELRALRSTMRAEADIALAQLAASKAAEQKTANAEITRLRQSVALSLIHI